MLKRKSPSPIQKKKLLIFSIILLLFFVFFNNIVKYTSFFYGLIFNKSIELKKQNSGDINILLLGIGGQNHEGPDLTDTIIFANINPQNKNVNLISIPRDLWIPKLSSKINKAYSDGQENGKKGILLVRTVVEKIVGRKINYVVVIDFSGFVKLVDYIQGIDIEIKNELTDLEYPIEGKENDLCDHTEEELPLLATSPAQLEAFPCRYKTVHFLPGNQHMDGLSALEFVRSRHAQGSEGTDFARSSRQQLVISAIREKVFSIGTLLNPVKVIGIYSIISNNINTDIATSEFDDFIKLAKNMKDAKIKSHVIDFGDEKDDRFGLLYHPEVSEDQGYQWVLIPRVGDGNFSEINDYVDCIIKGNKCLILEKGIDKASQSK